MKRCGHTSPSARRNCPKGWSRAKCRSATGDSNRRASSPPIHRRSIGACSQPERPNLRAVGTPFAELPCRALLCRCLLAGGVRSLVEQHRALFLGRQRRSPELLAEIDASSDCGPLLHRGPPAGQAPELVERLPHGLGDEHPWPADHVRDGVVRAQDVVAALQASFQDSQASVVLISTSLGACLHGRVSLAR